VAPFGVDIVLSLVWWREAIVVIARRARRMWRASLAADDEFAVSGGAVRLRS
jgi:hypothetical protein